MNLLKSRHAIAEQVAVEAGRIAFTYFSRLSELVIEVKHESQDQVSAADKDVENFIHDEIRKHFPEDGFLGEESGLFYGSSGYVWVIDPIDGTSPFLNGTPNWCISIAVIFAGEPVIGVIECPCLSETFSARKGELPRVNGQVFENSGKDISDGLIGFESNGWVTPARTSNFVRSLLSENGNFIRLGSSAMSIAWVAKGRLTAFYTPHLNAWDCLAGHCIAEAAGCWVHPFVTDEVQILNGQYCFVSSLKAKDSMSMLINEYQRM